MSYNSTNKMLWILTAFAVVCIILAAMVKLHGIHSNPESKFTPEQREVLDELRSAQAQLDQTKADIADMLAKASLAAANIDTNGLRVQWVDIQVGDQSIVLCNGKPVLWGFRDDGVVLWKSQ